MFRRILGVVVVVPTSAAPAVDVLLVLELDELEETELVASGGAAMFFFLILSHRDRFGSFHTGSKISGEKAEKNVLFSLLFLNEDNYNFDRSSEDFHFFLSYK